jgi:hypothetical protein
LQPTAAPLLNALWSRQSPVRGRLEPALLARCADNWGLCARRGVQIIPASIARLPSRISSDYRHSAGQKSDGNHYKLQHDGEGKRKPLHVADSLEGNELAFELVGQAPKIPMSPEGPDAFVIPRLGARVQFRSQDVIWVGFAGQEYLADRSQ